MVFNDSSLHWLFSSCFSLDVLCPLSALPRPSRNGAASGGRSGGLCGGEGGERCPHTPGLGFVCWTVRLRHSSNSEANGHPLRLEWGWTLPECSLTSVMDRLSIQQWRDNIVHRLYWWERNTGLFWKFPRHETLNMQQDVFDGTIGVFAFLCKTGKSGLFLFLQERCNDFPSSVLCLLDRGREVQKKVQESPLPYPALLSWCSPQRSPPCQGDKLIAYEKGFSKKPGRKGQGNILTCQLPGWPQVSVQELGLCRAIPGLLAPSGVHSPVSHKTAKKGHSLHRIWSFFKERF